MLKWFYGWPKIKGFYWYKRKEGHSIAYFDGDDYEYGFYVMGDETPLGKKDFKKVQWYGPILLPED